MLVVVVGLICCRLNPILVVNHALRHHLTGRVWELRGVGNRTHGNAGWVRNGPSSVVGPLRWETRRIRHRRLIHVVAVLRRRHIDSTPDCPCLWVIGWRLDGGLLCINYVGRRCASLLCVVVRAVRRLLLHWVIALLRLLWLMRFLCGGCLRLRIHLPSLLRWLMARRLCVLWECGCVWGLPSCCQNWTRDLNWCSEMLWRVSRRYIIIGSPRLLNYPSVY